MKALKNFTRQLSLPNFNVLKFSHVTERIKRQCNNFCSRVKFNKLTSLKSLIILGFVFAVIPLFLAVMYAAYGMREISTLGRTINSEVFEQTKAIRMVMQKTGDIERKAKLFVLLSDPALRKPYEKQSYETTRTAFKQALAVLLRLHVDNKISLLVNELSEKEDLIYEEIMGSIADNDLKLPIDEVFKGLRDSANNLSHEFESHVDQEFNILRQQSQSLERGLLIKGSVLLFISFVFITILLIILSRSVRQLDGSIRRLGMGELAEPIEVEGPSDLRFLGNRLEWLRTHLQDLETSKQQFMHNVAQEIDTPLAEISLGAQQLANVVDNYERQIIAQQLCNNVDKLKNVSKELQRFSQITTKPEFNAKARINLKTLLDSVIEEFKDELAAKAISLKMLVRPIEMSGIKTQLRDVLEQLLANAMKYSPSGSEIRIILREVGHQVELEIEDEGPGIDRDEREHVFEPFYRGKNSPTDESGENLGLGLAIVKEYVGNHHGTVEIIEPRLDQTGLRIRVQMPLTGEF